MTIREAVQLYVEHVWLVRKRTVAEADWFEQEIRPKLQSHLWPALKEQIGSTDRFHVFLLKIDPDRHGDSRQVTDSVIDFFQLA